jgi:hypothetical protein
MEHPKEIGKEQIDELNGIIEAYPYFQTARFLQLKALQNSGSYRFNQQLRITAAHSASRTVLFEYISTPDYPEKPLEDYIEEAVTDREPIAPAVAPSPAEEIVESTESTFEENESEPKIEIEAEKEPLAFSPNERHSFNEWLQLLSAHPVKREEEPKKVMDEILDRFIENEPTISRPSRDEIKLKPRPVETAEGYTPALMTETLARVYAEQGLYEKSINAYKILLLKYPEKSSLFAARISELQALKQNKT